MTLSNQNKKQQFHHLHQIMTSSFAYLQDLVNPCFYSLPLIYDKLYNRSDSSSMIIVVSPLTALMSDQVRLLTSKGVSSVSLGGLDDDQDSSDVKTKLANGYYQVVFTSPERLLSDKEWRDVFESDHIRQHLVGIIIDEAHCVHKW